VGSFSGRQTAVWAVWYVWHASVWAVWSNTLSYPTDCSHRCMQNIPYCIYTCLPED